MSSLHDSSLRGSPQTFPEVLVRNAELQGELQACSYLVDGEQESEVLSYEQLYQRVRARATNLAARFRQGERVLLVYPPGTEFVVGFFACLCAGLIPVPASPPDRRRGYGGLRAIADNSGTSAILTEDSLYERIGDTLGSAEGLGFLPLVSTSCFTEVVPDQALPSVRPADVALLQYTSGSTGTPRGVVVTHANLIINARELAKSLGHDSNTRVVTWLPMFHDMGLGSLLQCVWNAVPCIIMPARAFLQKPVRWLAAISKYRGTSSPAPNFAYDLCLRRVSRVDMEGLDLSCWQVAANGSEPVNPTTIECFAAKFAPCGFQREAMRPVYGLAEATLFVSSESAGAPPVVRHFDAARLEQDQAVEVEPSDPGVRALVSCGHTWLDSTTRIVHPRTLQVRGPGQVGEIWVRGPSVAQGYWLNEQATSATFGAVTSEGEGPFLRTGDTGFQDAEGRLFVTGRLKDLIIVRGRNHYPQDIELTVADCHEDLEPYAAAAFSVRGEVGESLVIVQEVKRSALRRLDAADVFRQIRRAVSEQHGLQTQEILLLRPGGLPRTTSGKVQRKECEARHRRGELSVAASWAARAEVPSPGESLFPPVSDSTRTETCRRVVEWLRARGAELALYGREPSVEQRELAAQQGLLGLQVAPTYGGLDLSEAGVVAVLEQLGAIDVGLACWVANANSCGTRLLQRYGQELVQRATLPGLVSSGAGAAMGQVAEPSVGLEPMSGDRYRLRGAVAWQQHDSSLWVLNALVPDPEAGGESMFALQVRPAGISIESQPGPTAVGGLLHMSASLDGIVAGGSELLGRRGAGCAVAEEARAHLFLGLAAACLGGLKRAAQLAVDFASRAPGVGGKPLLLHPVTLARLGPITASVTSLESLVGVLARSVDRGRQLPRHAFVVCKVAGPDLLWRAADDLVQLAGDRARAQAPLVRSLHADARMLRLFAGATETLAGGLGEEVLQDSEPLRRFLADTCSAPHLVPSLDQALEAVRIRNRQMAQSTDAPTSHWAAARAGELATWAVLLGGLESRRRTAWSDELARASAWVRASYERSLASVQGGTPSEAIALGPAAITEAVESYALGVGSLHPPAAAPPGAAVGGDLSTRPPPLRGSAHDSHRLREWIVAWLGRHLRMDVQQIDPDRSFADHGIDSMAAVQLAKALSDKLGQPLDETLLWNFATIGQLVEHLVSASKPGEPEPARSSARDSDSLSVEEELEQMEKELKRR